MGDTWGGHPGGSWAGPAGHTVAGYLAIQAYRCIVIGRAAWKALK